MSEGTPETRDEWLIDTDQMNRIEAKLDSLLAIWREFEPDIRKLHEFQQMSGTDKIKELMKGRKHV
jgi:hypothetical protein